MTGDRPGPARPRWRDVRAMLDAARFRPSRRLGQNFLLDENMVECIADDAEVGEGDFVLEVGAGCGFLSTHLAARGVRLVAVEIDRRLHEIASRLLAPWPEAILLRADALAGKHALDESVRARLPEQGPWHLVANLPYSIASPLLVVLARLPNPPASLTALVQAEVAARVTAEPGGGEWGPLSVRLQTAYRARRLRTVGPELFWPRPRVESAVIRLERRVDAEGRPVGPGAERLAALDGVVDLLFQQRRKAVLGLLAGRLGGREPAAALLERLGVGPSTRAGALSLEELERLAESPEWAVRTR